MGIDEENLSADDRSVVGSKTTDVPPAAEETLPPQDGGKGAWIFLAGAAIIEIVAWGRLMTVCSWPWLIVS